MLTEKKTSLYARVGISALLATGICYVWLQNRQIQKTVAQLQSNASGKQELINQSPETKQTQQTSTENSSEQFVNWSALPAKYKNSVVQVFNQAAEFNWLEPYKTPNHGEMYGSAFFINQEGDLITNAHVVSQSKALSVQVPSLGKARLDVDIIAVAPERDLALLRLQPHSLIKIEKELKKIIPLSFGNSDTIKRGDKVMALGYPLGQQFLKSTKGVVSGRQNIPTPMGQMHLIQIDAAINPGNSGGPSINYNGDVIGVNSMIAPDAQNIGWIIPSSEVQLFIKQARRTAPAKDSGIIFLRKPFIGIQYHHASDAIRTFLGNPAPGGLYIFHVYSGSPLTKIGLTAGDMLYSINNNAIDVYGEMNVPWSEDKISLLDFLTRLDWNDEISMTFYRKGKRHNVRFNLEPCKPLSVRRYYPGYEKIDYQVIGGLTIMELAINHIPLLLSICPELTRFADIKNQAEPTLVITNLFPDSHAARLHTLAPGTLIKEVNNQKVFTLADLRNALIAGVKSDFLTIKTSNDIFAALPLKELVKDERRLSSNYFYPLNQTTQKLLSLLDEQQKTEIAHNVSA